jgi:hypothetical protein
MVETHAPTSVALVCKHDAESLFAKFAQQNRADRLCWRENQPTLSAGKLGLEFRDHPSNRSATRMKRSVAPLLVLRMFARLALKKPR